jgi:uridylate kinase
MTQQPKLTYKRVLLKLSGEALLGSGGFGVDIMAVNKIANDIKELVALGVEVAMVLGGGNFLRGACFSKHGFNRVSADHAGMLATIMNGIFMRESLISVGVDAHILSAKNIEGVTQPVDRLNAKNLLQKNGVVIFTGGTGNPMVTTDTAAAIRAIEIDADIILKATKVDGVYSADPVVNKNATCFKSISFSEVITQQLAVMDLAAMCLCRDNHMSLRVFNMNKNKIVQEIVQGADIGTLVHC